MQRFQARFVNAATQAIIGMSNVFRSFSDMPYCGYDTYTTTGCKVHPKTQSEMLTYAVPYRNGLELVVVTYFC